MPVKADWLSEIISIHNGHQKTAREDQPDKAIINRIVKVLCPGIARRFSTSGSKVERTIRHAIEIAQMNA